MVARLINKGEGVDESMAVDNGAVQFPVFFDDEDKDAIGKRAVRCPTFISSCVDQPNTRGDE